MDLIEFRALLVVMDARASSEELFERDTLMLVVLIKVVELIKVSDLEP